MDLKYRFFWLFLWQYLKQPLFSRTYKAVLNTRRFWHIYSIELLEQGYACWAKEYSQEDRQHNWQTDPEFAIFRQNK